MRLSQKDLESEKVTRKVTGLMWGPPKLTDLCSSPRMCGGQSHSPPKTGTP